MSTPHHGFSPQDEAAQQRLIDEIFGRAKLKWPRGQISNDDLGETAFGIATDTANKIIRIHFTKPITWIGLDKDSAIKLRDILTQKIGEL